MKVLLKIEDENFDLDALVSAASNGCRMSFRELVIRYQNPINRLIFRLVKDEEAAKDLTQEVFIKTWKGLPTFNKESTFKTWVTRIAINTARSWFKSKAYKKAMRTEEYKNQASGKSISSVRLQLYENLLLEKAIEKLKTKHREVICLFYFEKMSYREISNLLDIPNGTVSSRLTAAHKNLRKTLKRMKNHA